jgi:DNA-binding transcriptional LysR family regulator
MELRHLRYFVTVAETRNITRAAERLRVAQPALSRQLRDLEDELGVTLLERGRKGVNVTAAGREFHRRAKTLLADAARAVDAARIAGGAIAGRLTLGFPTGLHLDHLGPVIEAFRAAHPQVEFAFVHGLREPQMKALRDGSLELAFVNVPGPLHGMDHCVVWRVPFAVVMPEKHRLAKRKSLEFADLEGENFVFCTRESRPEFYDEFFRHCTNAGFHPKVVQEVGGYPTTILALIGQGVGLSVVPHFEHAEGIRGLVWRPLDKPQLWSDFALVWPRKLFSPLVQAFVALARQMQGVEATPAGVVRGF